MIRVPRWSACTHHHHQQTTHHMYADMHWSHAFGISYLWKYRHFTLHMDGSLKKNWPHNNLEQMLFFRLLLALLSKLTTVSMWGLFHGCFSPNSWNIKISNHHLAFRDTTGMYHTSYIHTRPQAKEILESWLAKHWLNPYPTEEEKLCLAQSCLITVTQVGFFFFYHLISLFLETCFCCWMFHPHSSLPACMYDSVRRSTWWVGGVGWHRYGVHIIHTGDSHSKYLSTPL